MLAKTAKQIIKNALEMPPTLFALGLGFGFIYFPQNSFTAIAPVVWNFISSDQLGFILVSVAIVSLASLLRRNHIFWSLSQQALIGIYVLASIHFAWLQAWTGLIVYLLITAICVVQFSRFIYSPWHNEQKRSSGTASN